MPASVPLSSNTPFRSFLHGERGNVVIDWVVITAGVVGLGIVVAVNIGTGAAGIGEKAAVEMGRVGENL